MNAPRDPQWQNSITIYSVSRLKTTITQSSSPSRTIPLYRTMNGELNFIRDSPSDRIASSFAITWVFLTATFTPAPLSNALNTLPNALCLMLLLYSAPFSNTLPNFVILSTCSKHDDGNEIQGNCRERGRVTVQKWKQFWLSFMQNRGFEATLGTLFSFHCTLKCCLKELLFHAFEYFHSPFPFLPLSNPF